MSEDKYHREISAPAWSNPPLEDHKGHRLMEVGDAAFFKKGLKVFFGDVHIHTNYSRCGFPNNGNIAENLAYAREESRLDFAAVADHAEHLEPKQYPGYCREVEAGNDPGRFVTLPAFEWASHTLPTNGHRVVYFRERFGPLMGGKDPRYDTPRKLALALRRIRPGVIAPRHHPTYVNDWRSVDPDFEPVIEIHSEWGCSERDGGPLSPSPGRWPVWPGNYAQDGLARGHRFGFIGGGDCHNVRPGLNGITAVYADRLSRESVFDAIRSRHCYATSGAKILLDFQVNGHRMGSVLEAPLEEWPRLFPIQVACGVIGTASLARIELIENNRVVYTHLRWRGPASQMAFQLKFETVTYYPRYYYVRVTQTDGQMAWSSPVFIDYRVPPDMYYWQPAPADRLARNKRRTE